DPAAPVQHGLYWLVANLCERSPVLLAVDDLHWADPASARWLVYLARRLGDLPAVLVAAIRSPEPGIDPTVPAALASEPVTRVLRRPGRGPGGHGDGRARGRLYPRAGRPAPVRPPAASSRGLRPDPQSRAGARPRASGASARRRRRAGRADRVAAPPRRPRGRRVGGQRAAGRRPRRP